MKTAFPTRKARLFIVDDHPVMRRGLVEVISEMSTMEVCGEAASKDEALQAVARLQPDLVLVDISLGDDNGIDLIKEIKNQGSHVKMLVLSMHDEMLFAARALRAGAMGYVDKNEPTSYLMEAISQVLDNRIYLSAKMTDRVLHRIAAGESPEEQSPLAQLSNRELQVFEMIGKGLITKQIAARLGLSAKTIETYRENIKAKLNLHNTTELTREAVSWLMERG